MHKFSWSAMAAAGALAGAINGLLGAGGGMLLVPLLSVWGKLAPDAVFPASVSIMLPICLVSLLLSGPHPWGDAIPWLMGSAMGGLLAGLWGRKIPTRWLHRGLGILILWGGIRNLW